MFIKYCFIFKNRRCRYYLLRITLTLLSFCLLFQIYCSFIKPSSENVFLTKIAHNNISLDKPVLNCFGDPLKQWCQNQKILCNSSLIVYDDLFLLTRSVILQPKFAKGKRLGGEDMKDVLHQADSDEYFHFGKSFLNIRCAVPKLDEIFDNSHLSNVLSSATTYKTCSNVEIISETTIAVNRQDYVNIYHTITDLYTAYLLCQFFQRDPKLVRVLFLDAHPKGNLDILWSKLFHSFMRLGHRKNIACIYFNELIWSQPQPKSELDVDRDRSKAPSFFSEFRQHVLQQFHINDENNTQQLNCSLLNIFFLVRRNYVAHPRNPSGKISRQLSNEKEILDYLKQKFSNNSNINFSVNHFEELSMKEQLHIIVGTDIFVGMHGAGLTHVIFQKPNGALVELFTTDVQTKFHFQLLASMADINYHHCSITNGGSATAKTIYNCINKKISELCPTRTRLGSTK